MKKPLSVALTVGFALGFASSQAWDVFRPPFFDRNWSLRTLLDHSGSFKQQRILGTVTFYGSGLMSTGKVPGMKGYGYTHSGLPVGLGVAAADPQYYPAGTLIRVHDRYYLIADTGSEIKGPDRFDIYIPSDDIADQAGSQLEWVDIFR